ncbi:class I SAM-dependent methyltransferase [Kribbella sp. NPDC051586]|uniref:class I SAM-dependent methyltransferase n=1 Tax=Kribbella sp. NPDC051586 TaxID=3364118 RepID=UPI0037A9EC26
MAKGNSRLAQLAADPGRIRAAAVKRLASPMSRLPGLHRLRWRMKSRQEVFADIYDSAAWGSEESGSGTGSELRATETIRERLPALLAELGVNSLLDAPCGDWNWMRHVELGIDQYYGADIVPGVIEANQQRYGGAGREFTVADLTSDPLPKVDAILCRDCLVHVSYEDTTQILENFKRTGATWLLLNTYPEIKHNRNQFTGRQWRRLNFTLPPFNFPEPVASMSDGGDVDPSQLAVWRLQDLPALHAEGSAH